MLGMAVMVVGVWGAVGTSRGQAGCLNSFGVAKRFQLSCDVAAEWKVGG